MTCDVPSVRDRAREGIGLDPRQSRSVERREEEILQERQRQFGDLSTLPFWWSESRLLLAYA